MAVVIRMKRTGRRNRPCYRISVTDRAFPRDGRTLETLGVYDPVSPKEDLQLTLDVERARHWLSQGALPSDTVSSIFKRQGVYEGMSLKKRPKRTGRDKTTATKTHRAEAKAKREELKEGRRKVRLAAKHEARKAARAAAAAEGEGEE